MTIFFHTPLDTFSQWSWASLQIWSLGALTFSAFCFKRNLLQIYLFIYFCILSIKPIIHSSSLSTEFKYSETMVKGISLSEIQASCCKNLTWSNLVKWRNGLTKKITYYVFCCGSSVLDSGSLHSPTYHFTEDFIFCCE